MTKRERVKETKRERKREREFLRALPLGKEQRFDWV